MKTFILIILTISLTSCASNWKRYKQETDYNLMRCNMMCSSGNVVQIEKFNCACNLNKSSGTSSNNNRNTANGNVNYIYTSPQPQNTASQPSVEQSLGNAANFFNSYNNTFNDWLKRPQQNTNINNYGNGGGSGRKPTSYTPTNMFRAW